MFSKAVKKVGCFLFYKILYHNQFGYFTLASDSYYIKMLSFGKHIPENISYEERNTPYPEVLELAAQQLMDYLDGNTNTFTVPLAPDGSDFCKTVWNALLQIPYGETRTYGQIAQTIGRPGAARAVGRACHQNPIGILIPCHRVIGSCGALTGFVGGLALKQSLLQLERCHMEHCHAFRDTMKQSTEKSEE